MALRGTLTHRKTRRLAGILKISQCTALGILESLWHVTSENQHDGGIGRMPDQDIADEMYYDGDAGELILALVKSGWLDAVEDSVEKGRLYVHDWHEHADDSTKSKLIQWTKLFANGEPPSLRKLSTAARERVIERYEHRYGGFIGQKMRCVRTEPDTAHDAHGAHIQKPESRSQSPEARVQKPEDKQTSISVDLNSAPPNGPATSPQSEPGPPNRNPCPSGPILLPDKSMQPARTRGKPSDVERIDRMRAALHRFMSADPSGGAPAVGFPNPPDSAVIACLTAVGATPIDAVEKFLHGLWKKGQRRGRTGGPNDYPWFITVLQAHFRDGPAAVLVEAKPEPAGARV